MERKRSFYEKDTRDLVTSVTGFQEGENNFQQCLDFALSNFVFHQYADVNWFKIRGRIEGLCEKFFFHNECEKAHKLQSLSRTYFGILDSQKVHDRAPGYAILSLLLQLCGSVEDETTPVLPTLDENEKLSEDGGEDEDINWVEYLKEIECRSDEDESSWSDSVNLTSLQSSLQFSIPPLQRTDADSGIEDSPKSTSPVYPPLGPFQPYQEHEPEKPLVFPKPYWEPRYQSTRLGSYVEDNNIRYNFTKRWEDYLACQSPIYTPETNVVLTESQVLREVLWMLHGVKDTFLFPWNDDHFEVKRHIHLSHLTEDALRALLLPLCKYGEKLVCLTNFIAQATCAEVSTQYCQTYQAYAYGLQYLLQQYHSSLTSYEEIIANHDSTVTLIQIHHHLKPQFDDMDFLYHLHLKLFEKISHDSSAFVRCTVLLDSLWKMLFEYSIWLSCKSLLGKLLFLLLTTIRPYIRMIESVIRSGQLEDPYSEFFIVKNKNLTTCDEDFWDKILELRECPPDFLPDFFLRPSLESSLVAGKSIEMLRRFDWYYKSSSCYMDNKPDKLFCEFVEELCKLYCSMDCSVSESNANQVDEDVPPTASTSTQRRTHHTGGKYSSHIGTALKANSLYNQDTKHHLYLCQQVADIVHPNSLLMVGSSVQDSLMPCIENACHLASIMLVNTLKEKYLLMFHISSMRKYFLMEAGDVMFSFYTELFSDLIFDGYLRDKIQLLMRLKDCISYDDSETAERFFIELDEDARFDAKRPLNQLKLLRLTYSVDWPINNILSMEIQDGYCQMFRFLLQVKCAKYALNGLYCISLYQNKPKVILGTSQKTRHVGISKTQVVHGMYLLRMKLMNFVNGFHSYIMTMILHSSGLELDEKLNEAESLEEILLHHREYLESLFECCFLHSKFPHLHQQIHKILNLSVIFQAIWQQAHECVKIEELKYIEQEFGSSINFLTSYFKKIWNRASKLHLEVLASAILTDAHVMYAFS